MRREGGRDQPARRPRPRPRADEGLLDEVKGYPGITGTIAINADGDAELEPLCSSSRTAGSSAGARSRAPAAARQRRDAGEHLRADRHRLHAVFGVLQLVHLAHGEVFMIGAFIGLYVVLWTRRGADPGAGRRAARHRSCSGCSSSWWRSVPIRARGGHFLAPMVSTIGVGLVLQEVATTALRRRAGRLPAPAGAGTCRLGPVTMTSVQLLILGVALVLMLAPAPVRDPHPDGHGDAGDGREHADGAPAGHLHRPRHPADLRRGVRPGRGRRRAGRAVLQRDLAVHGHRHGREGPGHHAASAASATSTARWSAACCWASSRCSASPTSPRPIATPSLRVMILILLFRPQGLFGVGRGGR